MALVLKVRVGESVYIEGGRIIVSVQHASNQGLRLCFDADKSIVIDRKEVHFDKIRKAGERKGEKP